MKLEHIMATGSIFTSGLCANSTQNEIVEQVTEKVMQPIARLVEFTVTPFVVLRLKSRAMKSLIMSPHLRVDGLIHLCFNCHLKKIDIDVNIS